MELKRSGIGVGLVASGIAAACLLVQPALGATDRAASLEDLASDSVRPLEVRRGGDSGGRHFMVGRVPVAQFSRDTAVAARARDFWREYGAAFGVRDVASELLLRSTVADRLGGSHLRYGQRYRGLDVLGGELVLHFNGGAVTAINGRFVPEVDISTTPSVSAAGAAWTASLVLPRRGTGPAPRVVRSPELLVYAFGLAPSLAWRATIATREPLGLWRVFVDARTGEILGFYNDLRSAKNRETYTNGNDPDCNSNDAPQCVLPGVLRRNEAGCVPGPSCPDAVVNDVHAHTGTVYDYYSSRFARDSYDAAGHTMRSTVHFGDDFNNAFWCPDDCAAAFGSLVDGEQMVYGDGDGVAFSPLSQDIDVVAHELTHGVTEKTAGLIYFSQPGALNESYSDVIAVMVDTDNWLVGEDSFTPGTPGDALRSLEDPADFGQPAHMDDYVHTVYDNSGVHINSGIPNHAAYLAATSPGYGIGRPATERIYYWALTNCLSDIADFVENLNCLLLGAQTVFPGDAAKTRAIERAHAAVGIANPPAVTFPNGGETLNTGTSPAVIWNWGGDYDLPFEVAFLRDSGSTTYLQGFNSSMTLPAEFTTGGNQPWFVTGPTTGNATNSVRSGVIGDGQRSELRLVVRVTADGSTVNFMRRVRSEFGFDFLSFHIDAIPILFSTGSGSWGTPTISGWPPALPAGTHEFVWVYEKDGVFAALEDAGFIDDITIQNAENVTVTTINASTPAGASSQVWAVPNSPGSNYRLRVRRLGVAPWMASDDSNGTFAVAPPPPPPTPPSPPPSPPPAPAPPAPPPPPPPTPQPIPPGTAAIASRSVTVTRAGVAPMRLRCAGRGACRGTVRIEATVNDRLLAVPSSEARLRRIVLGSRAFTIPRGRTATVNVKLTRTGFRLLQRIRTLRARAIVSSRQLRGVRTARVSITLRAPARRR